MSRPMAAMVFQVDDLTQMISEPTTCWNLGLTIPVLRYVVVLTEKNRSDSMPYSDQNLIEQWQ